MAGIEVGAFLIDKEAFLRHGMFGPNYKAIKKATKEQVAVEEIVRETTLDSAKAKHINKLATLECPYLIQIKGREEENGTLWLFMDYCEHDLESYYIAKAPNDKISISLMSNMAAGLKYLHEDGLIHRDIQPPNIHISLVDPDQPVAKITMCRFVQDSDNPDECDDTIGTTLFMAPELFSPNLDRGQPLDIFALGLTYFAMTCFKPNRKTIVPSENDRAVVEIGKEMKQMQMYGHAEKADNFNKDVVKIPNDLSEMKMKVRKVIINMIECDQSKRLSAEEVKREIKAISKEMVSE